MGGARGRPFFAGGGAVDSRSVVRRGSEACRPARPGTSEEAVRGRRPRAGRGGGAEAARQGRPAPLPDGLHPAVAAALAAAGIESLWSHQRETYELLAEGRHVVVSTGTASGKSLCFTVPTLDAAARDPQARALYSTPPKRSRRTKRASSRSCARGRCRSATRGRTTSRRPPARRCAPSSPPSTTATRRRTSAPRYAATRPSSSRTPTCCTSASCRRTSAGPSSSII